MSTKDDIIFNSLDSQPLQTLTIVQLKKELRFRNLSLTGNKNELILRIVEDNNKRNSEGTLEELNVLRVQNLNNAEEAISDNAHLLTEIESLRKQVELLSNSSTQSPLPMPPPSQIDPNIAAILSTLMETQKQFLERQVNPNVIQITSTNDTANSIQIFKGDIIENVLEWLKEVERISTLANWSDELKLTNAISRLSGSAKNWQLTTGKNFNDWITWKNALASRFKRRITMQEFLAHQSERKLRHNESLVDYIYSKDALLEKAPFTIPQPDRISMIIGDITEEKWQIALATQNTNTVEELIDRATALDAIRSAKQEHKKHSPKSQIRSSYTHDEQRRKYNPVTDDVRDITCWRCGNKGHANSIVERANGIIVSSLKKMIDKNPNKWDELLPNALLVINTTKQNSTKKSPFYLLHGYEPRLPRELHIGSFIDDTPREDQLDLLTLARAEAANNVYETHLENKKRFDLHRRSHSFKAGDLVLYDWPKKGDHKLSPIFKGPFVIIRPVGAVCYEIKSTTQQNKFIKVVHVQHLRPYFKRNSPTIEENSTDEENESH
ncbi:Transposon Tf2-6 polyprotein like [Argiope bruennichi]|uniref:Transposon Tf2-6 polyprotein like n=1 Tax=Argiope bruennichi TaxID=94029 RepID=A0A8T0EV75_ARGBR|nr:Transposon Tf2-6 polyprotein like [Argiope bruennichi]